MLRRPSVRRMAHVVQRHPDLPGEGEVGIVLPAGVMPVDGHRWLSSCPNHSEGCAPTAIIIGAAAPGLGAKLALVGKTVFKTGVAAHLDCAGPIGDLPESAWVTAAGTAVVIGRIAVHANDIALFPPKTNVHWETTVHAAFRSASLRTNSNPPPMNRTTTVQGDG
jgi:hypothetical protein